MKCSLICKKYIRRKSDVFLSYRVSIMLEHVYFGFGKWQKLEFISKRWAVKRSIKTVWLNYFRPVRMVFLILKMNNLHDSHVENVWKTLLFCIYLDLGKWYNIEFFFKRCAVENSTKAVWTNSYNESEKSAKHFQYDGRWHCHVGCPFWI
jgi:hypothetical protein